jgi:hypothetical protein
MIVGDRERPRWARQIGQADKGPCEIVELICRFKGRGRALVILLAVQLRVWRLLEPLPILGQAAGIVPIRFGQGSPMLLTDQPARLAIAPCDRLLIAKPGISSGAVEGHEPMRVQVGGFYGPSFLAYRVPSSVTVSSRRKPAGIRPSFSRFCSSALRLCCSSHRSMALNPAFSIA